MGHVMTEPELSEDELDMGAVVRRDGVMERLAKLLADAAAPPDPRERLKRALVDGDFATMFDPRDEA
jgi:hypothetical protein